MLLDGVGFGGFGFGSVSVGLSKYKNYPMLINLSLSIELEFIMVDSFFYVMECLSSYFLLDLNLQKRFLCIYNITRPNECIHF